MLTWIRDKLSRRQSCDSRQSTRSSVESSGIELNCSNISRITSAQLTMQVEDTNKIVLHVIFQGEIWLVNIDRGEVISDLLKMAVAHFLDATNLEELAPQYKFISVPLKKVLSLQCTLSDEGLKNYDEILLVEKITTGSTIPTKLTILDIKGPNKQEIAEATANLTRKNPVQVVPALDCQENFQSEIRKVLYSLVEASAKILAQSPDAKVIFSGIATRISAKNKKEIDRNAIKYLKDLGFTEVQARYALRLKRNRQVEAMEWLLENSHRVKEDAETEDCVQLSASESDVGDDNPVHTIDRLLRDIRDFHRRHFEPSPRALDTLTAMGFSQDDAVEALRVTNNNQVAACEWLCGERDESVTQQAPGLDTEGALYKALMSNPTIQIGLYNPKIMLAFLSILENPSSANLWLNDVDTAPVLGQVFKTYHSEKHMIVVNQQVELMSQNTS